MYKRRHPPWRCCEAEHFILFHHWVAGYSCLKVSIHELSQDASPRSTKVEFGRYVFEKRPKWSRLNLNCLPTNLKRRPNCYTSPDEPLLFIISKLNVALLVFFVWMTRCPQLQFWRGVELKSMRLINIWLLSSSMLISEFCAQFLNFKEALNLTDLTWSLFLNTIQRTPFLKFRFLSTSYYL